MEAADPSPDTTTWEDPETGEVRGTADVHFVVRGTGRH